MIITITLNPSIDYSVIVNGLRAGYVNRSASSRIDAGGKGVNVSKVLRALGCDTIATGFAGRDNFEQYFHLLKTDDITADFIPVDGATRMNIKLTDTLTGDTTDINESGLYVGENQLSEIKSKLTPLLPHCSSVVISGSIGKETNPRIIYDIVRFCKASGVKVIADSSGEALRCACDAEPYMIKPNVLELSNLTGRELYGLSDIYHTAEELVDSGIHTVVVTMGCDGLIYVTPDIALYSPGISIDVNCTVGAGDAVTAAFAYAFEHGFNDADALRLAAGAGAAAAATPGSKSPARDEILLLARKAEIIEL